MRRRLVRAAVVLVVVFAAAQLVRPRLANPPTDPSRTIQGQAATPAELGETLDRACGDCHSNRTVWTWYTRVAPVSWLMAYGVKKGRAIVNFSEWSAYTPELQQELLAASCDDVQAGKMPGPYAWLRPETRLSPRDIETICASARAPHANAARRR